MADDVVIRCARLDERLLLEDLQRRAALMWDAYRESLLAHPDAIELPIEQITTGRVFVAEQRGVVLGFSVVLPGPDGESELDGLFVDPGHGRRGIGRLLVQAAERLATSEGAQVLSVIAAPEAQGFYGACGFEPAGEHSTRFGPALVMRRRLARRADP